MSDQLEMESTKRKPEKLLGAVVGFGLIAGCAALARLDSWIPAESDSTVVRTYLAAGILITLVLGSLKLYEVIWRVEAKKVTHRANAELSIFKDELIADVSHELRTPLTGIVGYARLLEESVLDGPNGEAVAVILGQTAELSRLIDDRVTAARIATGSLTLDAQATDVESAANQAADFLALHGIVVDIDCDKGDVMADPEALRHVIRNLLINAHHHGRPDIVVRGRVWERRYVIQVIDHGRGAEGPIVSALQATGRRGGPPVGDELGLGLSNARALALKMGGDLSYRHLGGETHFVVTLPMAIGHEIERKERRFEIPPRFTRQRPLTAGAE